MKTTLRLTSARMRPVELWLEPWGDRVCLTPECEYEVLASGSPLTLEWGEKSLTLWAGTGGGLEIRRDGAVV